MHDARSAARVVREAIFKWAEIREKFLRRNLFISLGDGRETEGGEGGGNFKRQKLDETIAMQSVSKFSGAGILMKGG